MRRREFIALLGSVVAGWPIATRAQQAPRPVIGFLGEQTAELFVSRLRAFRQGLAESGYSEGRNVSVEYRWAQGQDDRLPALAADLVRQQVAVIATTSTSSALAAKAATTTVPIVFATGSDPVRGRPRRQPQPARRQRHWRELSRRCVRGQTIGLAAPARAQGHNNWRARESRQS